MFLTTHGGRLAASATFYSFAYLQTNMAHTPARLWLKILGLTLVAVAILGLIPPVYHMLHDLKLHIEHGEMAIHWVLAAVTLAVAFGLRNESLVATLAIVFGVVYVVVGILGFFVDDLGPWHVAIGDNLLHLALGGLSLAAGFVTKARLSTGQVTTARATTARRS
jgi:hypothetical protein